MMFRLASHERPEIRVAYQLDMPDGYEPMIFEAIDTAQAKEGINLMQNFLEIDFSEPHPFRVYPEGHPDAGKPLMGRPRYYLVVADGQGELYWDEELGKLQVTEAVDEDGHARVRFERPLYRVLDNAKGVENTKPFKLNDDAEDVDRAIAGRWFPDIQPLTAEERARLFVDRHGLSVQRIEQLPAEQQIYGHMKREMDIAERVKEENKKGNSWLGNLDGWNEE
jgi:hypothetical protein